MQTYQSKTMPRERQAYICHYDYTSLFAIFHNRIKAVISDPLAVLSVWIRQCIAVLFDDV